MAKPPKKESLQPKLAAKDREAFLEALFKGAPPEEKPMKTSQRKKTTVAKRTKV